MSLDLVTGLTKVAGATESDATLKVQFSASDFGVGSLQVGPRYYVCVGIKTSAMTKFLELPLVDNRLVIKQDCIHD